MQEVYKQIGRVSQCDAAVLIQGCTGTGKELVARAIHDYSARRNQPFVAVNCGALPEHLVESELFGYQRGAFTGAAADKPGRFESASGGTLLLDEVGDLPLAAQVKLLRFLDSQTIERLGSVQSIKLDVRILAATNRDLHEAIAAGRFRSDLYYRLAVIQIQLPSLSQRREDILPLARHFLCAFAGAGRVPAISDAAAALLEQYPWPGNVRELRNAIEHAAVVCGDSLVLPAHLPQVVQAYAPHRPQGSAQALIEQYLSLLNAEDGAIHPTAVAALEKAMISRALEQCGGSQSAAAAKLGLHRNTLRIKIRELGLE
jgi:two-component system nitrogen regulation response regulator GlnG